jgi:rubrerythrin
MDKKTYLKIIGDAIQGEIEAYHFYLDVAQKTQNAYLKELFLSFSKEEQKHRHLLETFVEDPSAGVSFEKVPDYHVAETVPEPALTIDMKPADAIALAMKKEQAAMVHYTQLAEACSNPDHKKIFLELAAMERGHKAKMESAFVDIGYPEVW